MRRDARAVAALLFVAAPPLAAQQPAHGGQHAAQHAAAIDRAAMPAGAIDSAAREFFARTHTAVARYENRDEAIADGYRRIGPDFPAMGEHFVHPGYVFSGVVDAEHPQSLTYITVGDRVVLAGVAFVVALAPGASPPSSPVGPEAWHDHSGTLDGESILLAHSVSGSAPRDEPRVAMLHAWLLTPNPRGLLEPDNWALPYVRAGFAAPADPYAPLAPAKALSLATGSADYYSLLLRALGRLSPREAAAVDSALAAARSSAATWLDAQRSRRTDAREDPRPPSPPQLAALAAIWDDLWAALARTLPADVLDRLADAR